MHLRLNILPLRLRARNSPFVLHDNPLSNDLARVISDVGLVQRVGDVTTGRSEVSEVHHRYVVKVVVEVTGVVTARHGEQFRYCAQSIQSIAKCLFFLERDIFSPSTRDNLAEHPTYLPRAKCRADSVPSRRMRAGPDNAGSARTRDKARARVSANAHEISSAMGGGQ